MTTDLGGFYGLKYSVTQMLPIEVVLPSHFRAIVCLQPEFEQYRPCDTNIQYKSIMSFGSDVSFVNKPVLILSLLVFSLSIGIFDVYIFIDALIGAYPNCWLFMQG